MTNKVYNRIIETSSNTPATSGTVTVNLSGTSPSLTFVGGGTAAGRKFVDKYANAETCRVHIFETANPVRWVIADVTFSTGTPNTLAFVAANIKDGSAGAATIPSWAGSVTCAVEFGADYMQKLIGDREVLTAARTYYVRTDGSDSNDGLANTSGGAFLTLQKAIDVVCGPTLDFGGQTVTIQVGAGTYTTGTAVSAPWTGGGGLVIQGDVATPSNVVISSTGDCFAIAAALPGVLNFRGFKVASNNFGIHHNGGGTLKLENIDFGACLFQLLVDANGAYCDASGTGPNLFRRRYPRLGGERRRGAVDPGHRRHHDRHARLRRGVRAGYALRGYPSRFRLHLFRLGHRHALRRRWQWRDLHRRRRGDVLPRQRGGSTSAGGQYL
jgi:hypothetical protein